MRAFIKMLTIIQTQGKVLYLPSLKLVTAMIPVIKVLIQMTIDDIDKDDDTGDKGDGTY